MDGEEKRKLVENVIDLTVMNRFRVFSENSSGHNADMAEKARLRMREEQTSLYVRHFEPEQLIALLDFYNTGYLNPMRVLCKHCFASWSMWLPIHGRFSMPNDTNTEACVQIKKEQETRLWQI